MIPPYLIGATPPPPGPQAAREAAVALAPTLLDRVFPPEQSDPGWGDLYVATLHPDRRMMA